MWSKTWPGGSPACGEELGITVLLVEQNAGVALAIADYGYVLENGRVVLEGAAAELRGRREIQQSYLGQASGEERRQLSRVAASGGGTAEWLSSRSNTCRCSSAASPCSTMCRFTSMQANCSALIGPNGAGKTSVLNCISGIYRGQGTIRLRGEDINGRPAHEIARLGIARTFQHGEVFPQMTVLENVLTGRHCRIATNVLAEMLFLPSVRREELRHREAAEKILDFVGLTPHRHTPVGALPFGVQKLVGFARALALEPVAAAAR